ncbi:PSD1 and planctomycete cytochrome C domain-containing protein [Zavarzinella formosa]|uniref:PSD1 and planctomycete cytochrome C domain-containing protein n=1 Tax=Zavarzinella formosa TaxID=360055 RepID=UPI00031DFE48|nr:PSD1 and planctomycete cytochrome C domain-containing protein [Zavarzinella formosa]
MALIRLFLANLFLAIPVFGAPVDYSREVKPLLAAHCVSCHGAAKEKAGLRLDTFVRIKQGGNAGPIFKSGKSADSPLIWAITGSHDLAKMPPKGELPKEQIALLKRWIDEGAAGPSTPEIASGGPVKSTHWSFQPIKQPSVPMVKNTPWVRNDIDRFILARLEKENITPSPEADRVTYIRRLKLDLTGLPPTPAEVAEFLADQSPTAYESLVDRTLKSPHYGEMQARHWLDSARYADSNGYTIDAGRSIWKYRDWVINAFNTDMPFDRFTIEQLAGDLLPNPTPEQLTATGFHRNTMINQEGGIDVEQFRIDAVVDRVNTTGSVWLGLTVGCCQCHDHKFDQLSQREYYQFFAFFNNVDEPNLELIDKDAAKVRADIRARLAAVEKALNQLDPTSPETIEKWERSLRDDTRHLLPKPVAAIFGVAPNGRSVKQLQTLEVAHRRLDQTRHVLGGLTNPMLAATNAHLLTARLELEKARADLQKKEPSAITTMIVRERKIPRKTTILIGGDFTRKGVEVGTGFPAVLPAGKASKNRLDLAKWIVDPANPLTPRVTVNRVWGQLFGLGLVETENDFGTQGTKPSHPELLDYLAATFVEKKWSMRELYRQIVLSATYRQSSKARPELEKTDARNLLLARQNRIRVNAEVVRDVALAASGLLSEKVGGPSVFPPQPEGVYRFTQVDKAWKASVGEERYRRGMYTYFWRSAPHPQLVIFDAPDANTSCTRRTRSNTPLQALTLLNDSAFYEYAQALAARIVKEGGGDDPAKLRHGFQLCMGRQPTAKELARLTVFLGRQQSELTANPAEAKKLSPDAPELAPWVMVARVLLNLDEFITRE